MVVGAARSLRVWTALATTGTRAAIPTPPPQSLHAGVDAGGTAVLECSQVAPGGDPRTVNQPQAQREHLERRAEEKERSGHRQASEG